MPTAPDRNDRMLAMTQECSPIVAFSRFIALTIAVAAGAWVVGYAYLVKIAAYPAAGFFTFKMAAGLLSVSFILCGLFRLRGFFK